MVYRRGKLSIAGWYLAVAAFWAMAMVLTFALLVELFGLHGWNLERIGVTVGTGLITFASIRAAMDFQAWIRPFRTNFLEINDEGIHLRLENEARIPWPEISALRHERLTATTGGFWPIGYRVDDYILTTSQGPLSFTSMDIPRAKRAAQEIAVRIEKSRGSGR